MNKKAVKIWVFILLFCTIPQISQAESDHAVIEFNEADAIVLGANMIINGSMGGTGAYLTVHPNANATDFFKMIKSDIYWRGFGQGMIGGSLVYVGEKTMTMQPEFEYSVLAGKQISDLGTSVTYSASQNENWLENPSYITDFGPLVFHWKKSTGPLAQIYILPNSLYWTIERFCTFAFEPELSLKTGILTFHGDLSELDAWGQATANISVIDTTAIKKRANDSDFEITVVLGHEAIHTRQLYFQYLPNDALINYGITQATEENRLVNLSFLRYENHPFRFGADTGSLLLISLKHLYEDTDINYELTPYEYPSTQLANYNFD